uniref:Uncharacterized protein n=1 Tax=Neogobius melanostomus TaxID=47308 RepID=A0A8C6SDN5_9GOBI
MWDFNTHRSTPRHGTSEAFLKPCGVQFGLQSRVQAGLQGKGAGLTEKLLRLDGLRRKENEVMEPKKKRGFTGNSAPWTVSAAEKGQPPPIDRIGTGRLPGNKG